MKKTANNFILYIIFIHYYYQYHTTQQSKEHVEEKTYFKCEHTNRRKKN